VSVLGEGKLQCEDGILEVIGWGVMSVGQVFVRGWKVEAVQTGLLQEKESGVGCKVGRLKTGEGGGCVRCSSSVET